LCVSATFLVLTSILSAPARPDATTAEGGLRGVSRNVKASQREP
jgi:hypothetical protein